jgi:hypothetical protein
MGFWRRGLSVHGRLPVGMESVRLPSQFGLLLQRDSDSSQRLELGNCAQLFGG